jgi:hypothetical protein
MDLMAGFAFRQLRAEIVRKLQDRGLFQSSPRQVPPSGQNLDLEKYDQFLKEEMVSRQRRQRKLNRQNLVWVVVGMLLPLLLVILQFLFF